MKEKYLKYLNEDIKFDKTTMIGIFSLLMEYLVFFMNLSSIILTEE